MEAEEREVLAGVSVTDLLLLRGSTLLKGWSSLVPTQSIRCS